MTTDTIFKVIKASVFLPTFCPNVTNWKHKMRGQNSRGGQLDFTDQDRLEIEAGLEQFLKQAKHRPAAVKK